MERRLAPYPTGLCLMVRLSYAASQIPQGFWACMAELAEGVFAVEHSDAARPHVHMALMNVWANDHDRFRRMLLTLVKEYIETDPPKGNSLMSVKKWDGAAGYYVYMLKGERYKNIVWNTQAPRPIYPNAPHMCSRWIPQVMIDEYRTQWVDDESKFDLIFRTFTESPFNTPPRQIQYDDFGEPIHAKAIADLNWDSIYRNAIQFSIEYFKSKTLTPKIKFYAKEIISNYCWRNKIKMRPVYI